MSRAASWIGVLASGAAVLCVAGALSGHAAQPEVSRLAAATTTKTAHFNVGATHSPELLRRLAGTARPAISAASALAKGVDVASFQHAGGASIDWGAVAAAGYKFAFIKATEGSYYANPYFAADYQAAKAAGLAVAAYHFANPADSAAALQADYAADTAAYAPDGRTLPVVLDIEYDPYASQDHTNECYGLSPTAMVAWIRAFTAELQRRTGRPPVIYTTADWWAACTGGSTAFAGDPLWIASYAGTSPAMPAGWAGWEFWQYTSSGSVAGISGPVDISYLNDAVVALLDPGPQAGSAGRAGSLAVTALGDPPGQTPAFSAAGLPPGMTIDTATGVISGTWPATAQSGTATVTATSGTGAVGTTSYRWHAHGPVSLVNPGRQSGTSRDPASLRVQAADGLPGCTLSFAATSLPPGLTMTRCGAISGWLAKSGDYRVTVRVSDSTGITLKAVTFAWTVQNAAQSGRSGPVRLAGTRTCVTAPASAGPVTAVRCDGRSRQAWTVAANGTVRAGRACLSGPGPAGTAAALGSCAGAMTQRWENVPGTGLVNSGTGECLQDPGSATGGAVLRTQACGRGASEQWILPPGPLVSGIPGRCATALPASPPRVTTVAPRPCGGTSGQRWLVKPDRTIRILRQCLEVGGAKSVGSLVTLAPCTGGPPQRWRLFGMPLGARLVNPASGLCLASPADRATLRTRLALEPCQTRPGTTWHLG